MRTVRLLVLCIFSCISAIGAVLALSACSASYQPEHKDELLLVDDRPRSVVWDDVSQDDRFELSRLQTILGESDEDVWVCNRGARALVFNASGAAACYLQKQEDGLYSLFAEDVTSFADLENVPFPMDSVDAMGRFKGHITIETPKGRRDVSVKDFCLSYGLWEYEGSGVTHRHYSVESYHRKSVLLGELARERTCTIILQSGEAIDAALYGNLSMYWYRGEVCIVDRDSVVVKVIFGEEEEV